MFLPWVGLEEHLSNYPAWWLLAYCNSCLNLPDELRIVRRPRISSIVATSQRTFLGICSFGCFVVSLNQRRKGVQHLATICIIIYFHFFSATLHPTQASVTPEICSFAFPPEMFIQLAVFCWLPIARVLLSHDSHQVFLDICRQMRKKSLAKEHQKTH